MYKDIDYVESRSHLLAHAKTDEDKFHLFNYPNSAYFKKYELKEPKVSGVWPVGRSLSSESFEWFESKREALEWCYLKNKDQEPRYWAYYEGKYNEYVVLCSKSGYKPWPKVERAENP